MTTTDTTDTTDNTAATDPARPSDGPDPSEPTHRRGPFGAIEAPGRSDEAPVVVDLGGDPDDDLDVFDVFDDVVDPRLRARWIETRRAEGRRRLVVICGIAGAVALGVMAYVIAHSSLLGAGSIDVQGSPRTPAAVIRAAARVPDGAPLLFLDEGAVAARVEALPMVARAEVSTELPSTVVIKVTERLPLGWMRAGTAPPVAVLDGEGRVLERVDTPPAGLTRVRGLGEVGAPGTRLARPEVMHAFADLPPLLRAAATRFDVRSDDGPVLVLGDPNAAAGEIRFGSLTDMQAKATAALAVMASLGANGEQVAHVDVQVPDAPVTPR
jgi:cell division protein FtsQ